jgi:hypothetical protein
LRRATMELTCVHFCHKTFVGRDADMNHIGMASRSLISLLLGLLVRVSRERAITPIRPITQCFVQLA